MPLVAASEAQARAGDRSPRISEFLGFSEDFLFPIFYDFLRISKGF